MLDRTPLLAGNWKMHKTVEETEAFLGDFLRRAPESGSPEVVVCPPYPSLKIAVELCLQSRVRVAAQNMHEEAEGAFTGEVSAPMLLELGVSGVILGHSERRQYFGESDEALARKVPAALRAGLEPILCIGENESQRDSDETAGVLTRQVEADLSDVADDRLGDVVIAYEPIWAIGTGRTATPDQAQEAIGLIRGLIEVRSAEAAAAIRILYGGSVKPDNAAELIGQPDIDGALVGGASLDPGDFAAIVDAAATRRG
jgi:triosephosphate isomerase